MISVPCRSIKVSVFPEVIDKKKYSSSFFNRRKENEWNLFFTLRYLLRFLPFLCKICLFIGLFNQTKSTNVDFLNMKEHFLVPMNWSKIDLKPIGPATAESLWSDGATFAEYFLPVQSATQLGTIEFFQILPEFPVSFSL